MTLDQANEVANAHDLELGNEETNFLLAITRKRMRESKQANQRPIKTNRFASVTGKNGSIKMNVEVKPFTKTVKLLTGEEVEKKGTITTPVFTNDADVIALLGENLAVFAAYGFAAYCKQDAANKTTGSGKKEKTLKAALRNFKNSLDVAVTVMGMDKATAVEAFLAKEMFAPVKTYMEELKVVDGPLNFDYSEKFPVPKYGAKVATPGDATEDSDDDDES